jgi:hypothetical protein
MPIREDRTPLRMVALLLDLNAASSCVQRGYITLFFALSALSVEIRIMPKSVNNLDNLLGPISGLHKSCTFRTADSVRVDMSRICQVLFRA